ncbi:hypothetical protein KKG48_03040, partial [Patescibacteria group bacterium]|nr:hypothetical protein [Patescibacteria group bacterium]
MINYSEQEEALAKVRKNIILAIKRLEIDRFVVLEEIEQELRQVETAFQSLLLLGILRRIMVKDDDKSAKLFVPAITEWKNYFPHKDLGGLTPFEYRQKYPPGVYETGFITELMNEYQARIQPLDGKNRKGEEFDLEKDFSLFQEEFLERLPAEQPFPQQSGKFMNFRDVIIEERRRNGHPEESIDKIGAQIFVENTPDG